MICFKFLLLYFDLKIPPSGDCRNIDFMIFLTLINLEIPISGECSNMILRLERPFCALGGRLCLGRLRCPSEGEFMS